jgi:hypothetical protein
MPFQLKKPSTGFLVATVALVLALGGTAVASQQNDAARAGSDAAAAPLTKKQVKKIAKKIAKKEANKAITARAPGLTVAKAALADNATKAAMADTATNATNAANAAKVGNIEVVKFSVNIADDGPGVVLVNLSGLSLVATCPAGIPDLEAFANGGQLRHSTLDNGDNVSTGGTSNVSTTGSNAMTTVDGLGNGFVEYTAPSGAVVTVLHGYRNDVPD